jgi:integral membrane sensor domain MASE1
VALVSMIVFSQTSLPLLFLPVLTVILAAFRTGREGAAIAVVIVALVGGTATATGNGAVQLVNASPGVELLFFQF